MKNQEKRKEKELQKLWDKKGIDSSHRKGYNEKAVLVQMKMDAEIMKPEKFEESFKKLPLSSDHDAWNTLSEEMLFFAKMLGKDSGLGEDAIYFVPYLQVAGAFDIGNIFIKLSGKPERKFAMMGPINEKIDSSLPNKIPGKLTEEECAEKIEYNFIEKVNMDIASKDIKPPNTINVTIENITKSMYPEGKVYENLILTELNKWKEFVNMDKDYKSKGEQVMDVLAKASKASRRFQKKTKKAVIEPYYYIIHCVYYADVSILGNFYDTPGFNLKNANLKDAANFCTEKCTVQNVKKEHIDGKFYDPAVHNSDDWMQAEYEDIPIAFSFLKFYSDKLTRGNQLKLGKTRWWSIGNKINETSEWKTTWLQPIIDYNPDDEMSEAEDKFTKVEGKDPKPKKNTPKPKKHTPTPGKNIQKAKNTIQKPGDKIAKPKKEVDKMPKPKGKIPKPGDKIPKPKKNTPKPKNKNPRAGKNIQKPKNKIQKPGNKIAKPKKNTPKPKNKIPTAGKKIQKPKNKIQNPKQGGKISNAEEKIPQTEDVTPNYKDIISKLKEIESKPTANPGVILSRTATTNQGGSVNTEKDTTPAEPNKDDGCYSCCSIM